MYMYVYVFFPEIYPLYITNTWWCCKRAKSNFSKVNDEGKINV